MIFFVFVAFILVAGFLAITWRKRNRNKSSKANDEPVEKYTTGQLSHSAFNEPSADDIKGGVIPADNKLSQNDFDDETEVTK